MKRLFSLMLCLIIVLQGMVCVKADGGMIATESMSDDLFSPLPDAVPTIALVDGKLDINAKSCVLIEADTGTVLYENNPDERLAPASITKIMPLLLIMEAIDAGKLTLETQITASEHACSMGGSQIWLEPGESMTLHEMLKAIVIASANDATVAVGEAIAGSEEGFVALMNKRAAELGMTNTNFVNCTGLDAEGHLTTAYDVALMSCALISHELITEYSTVWMDTLRNGESELVNTNKLVRFYDGCIGLKTGTTSQAGSCLSAAARRDSMTLIAVVMAGADSNSRFQGARKMLDFGFANYSVSKIAPELPEESYVLVKGGEKRDVKLYADGEVSALTRKGEQNIERVIDIPSEVPSPVKKDDVLGKITVLSNGEEVGSIEIKAAEDVRKRSFILSFSWLIGTLFAV